MVLLALLLGVVKWSCGVVTVSCAHDRFPVRPLGETFRCSRGGRGGGFDGTRVLSDRKVSSNVERDCWLCIGADRDAFAAEDKPTTLRLVLSVLAFTEDLRSVRDAELSGGTAVVVSLFPLRSRSNASEGTQKPSLWSPSVESSVLQC